MNIGIEFETAEGYLFDTNIAATLRKNKIISVNIFEVKIIDYILEFDGGKADIDCNNNLTRCEFEQLVRKTFFRGKNIKLFSNMKKINRNMYIKNFEKFQLVFKNMDKQFSLYEMIDRKFEVIIRNKSFIFMGRFFNGWNINRLEDYIGSSVGNRKNDFIINFINSKFDSYKNISLYGIPDKIFAIYIGNTERKKLFHNQFHQQQIFVDCRF
jgi:hypothetical protein